MHILTLLSDPQNGALSIFISSLDDMGRNLAKVEVASRLPLQNKKPSQGLTPRFPSCSGLSLTFKGSHFLDEFKLGACGLDYYTDRLPQVHLGHVSRRAAPGASSRE
jgi:hypothetical protein